MRFARLLLIPVLAGLVASIAAYAAFGPGKGAPAGAAGADTVPALVARQPVALRTLLKGSMFEVRQVPRDLGAQAVRELKDVEGRINTAELQAGEILLKAKLAEKEKAALPYRIPEGRRAMTLRVDEFTGVAGYPEPGDRVDVIVTYQNDPAAGQTTQGRKVVQSRLVFEDLEVLARGPKAGSQSQPQVGDQKLSSLTVAVRPEEAVELALVQDFARITLVLRPAVQEKQSGPIILDDGKYRTGR